MATRCRKPNSPQWMQNLSNADLTADEKGQVCLETCGEGAFAVYFRNTRKESGEFNGQKYTEIRDFATLTFNSLLESNQHNQTITSFGGQVQQQRSRVA